MRTGRILLVIAFLALMKGKGWGQYGNPFITNLTFSKDIFYENYDIVQDKDGNMLFANRDGLLTYNGLSWNIVDLPVHPLTFFYDSLHQELFLGCVNDYGMLRKTTEKTFQFTSLSGNFSEVGDILWISSNDDYVFFLSRNTLSRINLQNMEDRKIWRAAPGQSFEGMIVTAEAAYVCLLPGGLHLMTEEGLRPIPIGYILDGQTVLFSFPIEKDLYLAGTGESRLYLFDGENLISYEIKDQSYLEQNMLTSGIRLLTGEIALSTRTGGCLVIDRSTRNTDYTFNYQNGLPDDEIYCMGLDNNLGLWLAHEYGVSRVDFSFPVRNFNIYPGLEGNLTSSLVHQGTLYVSTSEGIYYLKEIKNFKEVEVLVPVVVEVPVTDNSRKEKERTEVKPTEPAVEKQTSQSVQQQAVPQEQKKSFFQRLFGKKKAATEEQAKESVKEAGQPEAGNQELAVTAEKEKQPAQHKLQKKTKYVKKKVSALQSITYAFTKIDKLNGKCRYFISHQGHLLAATNIGLFEIKDYTARPILTDENIFLVEPSVSSGMFFAGSEEGIILVQEEKNEWEVKRWSNPAGEVYSLWQEKEGNILWAGAENKVYRISVGSDHLPGEIKSYLFKSTASRPVLVREIDGQARFFPDSGIYMYDPINDRMVTAPSQPATWEIHQTYITSQEKFTWTFVNQEWKLLTVPSNWQPEIARYLRLFGDINDIYVDSKSNLWVVHGRRNLGKILAGHEYLKTQKFEVFLTSIIDKKGEEIKGTELEIGYDRFPVEFRFSAPYFVNSDQTEYQYLLTPIMDNWSQWNSLNKSIIFHDLRPGKYTLNVHARNILGTTSNTVSLFFTMAPPFYQSWWFISSLILAFLGLVYLVVWLWIRKLQHDKQVLETKVKERTAEINKQKEEIEAQRDEIETKRDEIVSINKEITESIHYASQIQAAILTPEEYIRSLLPSYFILYKPRDIVSGDFYWVKEWKGQVMIAAGDCTGHGVPGAFMSMLAVSLLDEIADHEKVEKASEVLTLLREKIIASLHQTGREDEAQDGLDISMCILDKKKGRLQFSGAFNPLYHFRDGKLTVIKGDKMPIGIFDRGKKSFTNHMVEIHESDSIYLFTDGFIDQFGGEIGAKFKSSNFMELLTQVQGQPIQQHKDLLEKAFNQWRGEYNQVDDVLVIGFRME
jgi:serine phosphatase RsbU (regulator of sigma subunit)/ligand-binding sensor domain-containing protein